MPTKTVDIREPQTNLQDLLSLIREGAEIVLTDGATPLARMVPILVAATPRPPGLHSGAIWTSEDFDDPLPSGLRT